MAYHANQELFAKVIEAAIIDEEFRGRLLERPNEIMNKVGLCIPDEEADNYNGSFREDVGPLIDEGVSQLRNGTLVSVKNLQRFSCSACKYTVWGIAVVLAGLTGAALTNLALTSAPVIALASFAGVSVQFAHSFIVNAGVAGAGSVGNCANAICRWINACP